MIRTPLVVSLCAWAVSAACTKHSGDSPALNNVTTPQFETRIEIPTPAGEHSDYVVADLNGDRQLDMAIVGLSGELQVLLGAGTVFTPGQVLNLGGRPIWIASGDFDRDGDRDLVVVRVDASEAVVLFNDGNAQFTVGPLLAAGDEALSVVVGDANDDGLLDVVISRPSAPEIGVFLGDGLGGFTPGPVITLPAGGSPFTLALGDVTRDGIADLVVSDSDNDRVLVYAGGGPNVDYDPTPAELAVAGAPKASSIGDLDGDGYNDIAVSAFAAGQFVVVTGFPAGQTGPVAYTSFTVPVDGAPSISVIGDVTGDGRADLVGCVFGRASVAVAPQLPGGTLGQSFQLDATGLPLRPALGDFDQNGQTDLVVLAGRGDRLNLWLARNSGELIGSRNWDVGLITSAYAVAGDFDRSGANAVAVGNNYDTRLVVMRSTAGRMEPAVSIELGRNIYNVRKVDLDRDGLPDLVVPVDNGVKVLRNVSTPGTFAFDVLPAAGAASFGSGVGPFGVAVADLDRDGRFDLAIADFASGELQLLRGSADPFEFPGVPRTLSIGGGPADVAAADFTGDGIVDIAVSRNLRSDIVVFENDGRANLSLLVSLPTGAAPNYLLTNDFDRDGRSDLVVSNGSGASVTVLFGSPQGFDSVSYPAGQTPTALLAEDMTNDGNPDILVAALVGGDFRVLVNDGRGGFGNVFPFPGVLGASSAAMADLDADGDRDLVIASLTANRLSVVLNSTR